MTRLYIEVIRSLTHPDHTLLHVPIVSVNDGTPQPIKCRADELLGYLKRSGFSDEEIERAQKEIEDRGQTTIGSTKLTAAELERILSECSGQS